MSATLPGEHYCENHQGNHSRYDKENCTVCKLVEELANAHGVAQACELRAERAEAEAAALRTSLIEISRMQNTSVEAIANFAALAAKGDK